VIYNVVKRFAPEFCLNWISRVESSPIGTRLARGMFWSAVGAVSSRSLTLIATIITARITGDWVFGELSIIQSTIMMFTSFGTLAMGLTATKYVAELRTADPARAGRIIAMSSLVVWVSGAAMALLVVAAAPWICETLAAPHLTTALRVAAIGLVFSVVNEAQMGVLSGFEAFRRVSTLQWVSALTSVPILIGGVYWWGLLGAVYAQVIALALFASLNAWGIRQEARRFGVVVDWKGALRERKVFSTFTLPTFIGGIMYAPVLWLGNSLMVNSLNGYAEMGVFSAADRWRTAIMFLPSLLGSVALPMLTNLNSPENAGTYRRVLSANIKASAGAAFVAALPVALLSTWIMKSYGAAFTSGRWALVILCFSCVAAAAVWIIDQSLFSKGRVWLKMFLNALWASVFIATIWFGRDHGATGRALALLSADSIRLLVLLVMINRRVAI
jgi:O-antigen/teichoic acid export membrane protein